MENNVHLNWCIYKLTLHSFMVGIYSEGSFLLPQEQTDPAEMEASASAALKNAVPALAGQAFSRTTPDPASSDPANKKKEYDNPYFEPQYGFPADDDADSEEQEESYTPRFNQNLNGNKYIRALSHTHMHTSTFWSPTPSILSRTLKVGV